MADLDLPFGQDVEPQGENGQEYKKLLDGAIEKYVVSHYNKGNATAKQIQQSFDSTIALCQTVIGNLQDQYKQILSSLPSDLPLDYSVLRSMDNSFAISSSIFDEVSTEHLRHKYLLQKGLIMPRPITIGRRTNVKSDGSQGFVPVHAQYVSVLETLARNYIPTNTSSKKDRIVNFSDTDTYRKSDYYRKHPTAFSLILYHDDIEVGNALGSKAGVNKLTMFYFSVHGQTTGKLRQIHLAIVCHSSDVKTYGYSIILEPLINDLRRLNSGVEIAHGDGVTKLFARLEHLVGDNLAANQILGLVCSFHNTHFCRFCYIGGQESRTCTSSGAQLKRSAISHHTDIELLYESPDSYKVHGVKQSCPLDGLGYFHSITATVPDIMHDILEGVGKKELKLLIKLLIHERFITLDELNEHIRTFNFGYMESSNRPSVLTGLDIKQTAAQTWCLMRFLPAMIGHKVPQSNKGWGLFLLLRTIMDLIFAPEMTEDATFMLDGLVKEHHIAFLEVYEQESLSPKHHFMSHYAEQIRRNGPLSIYWCMRFESKHRLAKLVSSVSCSFRNVPLTVAKRYQLKDFADGQASESWGVSKISVGDVVVTMICPIYGHPVFGRVLSLNGTTPESSLLHCQMYKAFFNSHYHSFEVESLTDSHVSIKVNDLAHPFAVGLVNNVIGRQFICPRYTIF